MENKPDQIARVCTNTRVYYFDVLKDKKGQQFLSISEIPTPQSPGKKKRHRIFIHSDHIEKFTKALDKASKHIMSANVKA